MTQQKGYKSLLVWQEAIKCTIEIDHLTRQFPKQDLFTYCAQMRRAALSIPSNIAEGYGRLSRAELKRFTTISLGSAMELETQLIVTQELKLAPADAFTLPMQQVQIVLRLLTRFYQSLSKS